MTTVTAARKRGECTRMNRKAKLISISIEKGDSDLLFATSPEMKALFVLGRGEKELKFNIMSAIADIYLASDRDVEIFEVEGEGTAMTWVIIDKQNQ